jgi:uncharacterized protein YdeI (YjbR/CyaY-like superfamily)
MVEITETLYVTKREGWRAWLQANYQSKDEIWLVYYKAESGRPRIGYNEAVEEALCFGWIDSTAKKIDEASFAQRFSRRRPNSAYSQTNIERLRRLVPAGYVMPGVVESLGDLLEREFVFPKNIMEALRADEEAWKHFQTFSPAYQRIRVAYVESRRERPEEFEKRLANLVKQTARGRQFGVDIEAYY